MHPMQSALFLERILNFMASCVALWFGSGLIRKAPGTWGTLASVPLVVLLYDWPLLNQFVLWLTLFVVGIWATRKYCLGLVGQAVGSSRPADPSEVVIDEVLGFWLVFIFLKAASAVIYFSQLEMWKAIVLGFIYFRVFDIWKPFPIRHFDRYGKSFSPGTWQQSFFVILDDLLAAVCAFVCLAVTIWLISN